MKAISLHQPWASLCVTRQPCHDDRFETAWLRCEVCGPGKPPPLVKRFETRTWACPPNLIGSRIALHATQRKMRQEELAAVFGPTMPLWVLDVSIGAVVGSAVIEACSPIRVDFTPHGQAAIVVPSAPMSWTGARLVHADGRMPDDVSDQLPYGDYRPGRYAWLLTDAAPTTERCPWCWGRGWLDQGVHSAYCPVCERAGFCEPIPARGRQRIWNWQP